MYTIFYEYYIIPCKRVSLLNPSHLENGFVIFYEYLKVSLMDDKNENSKEKNSKIEKVLAITVMPYLYLMLPFVFESISIDYPRSVFIGTLIISGIAIFFSVIWLHIEAYLKDNFAALIVAYIYQIIIFAISIYVIIKVIMLAFY